jgi:type 1 glutamine amidotransferase
MKRSAFLRLLMTGAVAAPMVLRAAPSERRRKLVLIAGRPSHPPMMHEHRAGNLLLAKRLRAVPGLTVECHEMGWVKDEATLSDADALVIFSDGGGGHPAIQDERLGVVEKLIERGAGFGCIHYGVEVPKDRGATQFRDWIGGCYEHEWSCNPMWTASYETFPEHPVCQGVKPFAIHDEWYFNMRFREGFGAEGSKTVDGIRFTPLLVARPSDATRDGPYVWPSGPYAHIQAAKGRPEAMMWAVERPDGGRGFGFTGGHFHKNWQDDQFRKVVLNAICWVTGVEVPREGIVSAPVSDEELRMNLDPK